MNGKRKKKGLWILLLLFILVIPILVTVFVVKQNLDVDLRKGTVTSLTLIHGEKKDEVKDKEDVAFFIDLAYQGESIEKTAKPLSEYRKCEAVFHKLNRDVTFIFYLSNSVRDCVYTDPQGQLFLIPEEEATKLLAHPLVGGFAVSYAAYPVMTFTQGGETFGAKSTEGEWSYWKTNGTRSTEKIREASEETVILPQGEMLQFAFSLQPDYCSVILQNEKGEILFSGDPGEMELITRESDEHLSLVAKCDWYEEEHEEYHGSLTYTFDVFYDIPASCSLDRSEVSPGEIITLTVLNSSSEDLAVSSTFAADRVQKVQVGSEWSVLIPVSAFAAPGDYSVMIMGSDVEQTFPVSILSPQV